MGVGSCLYLSFLEKGEGVDEFVGFGHGFCFMVEKSVGSSFEEIRENGIFKIGKYVVDGFGGGNIFSFSPLYRLFF